MRKVTIGNLLRTILAVAICFLWSQSLWAQDQRPEGLWIGVLAANGGIVPIALYKEGLWEKPWPEPAYDREEPATPPGEAPSTWYVVGEKTGNNLVRVEGLVLANTYCGMRWAQVTDRDKELPRRESSPVRIVGMVLSQPLDLIQEGQIPGMEEYRERNRLVSNLVKGEGFLESSALGYFRLGTQLIGVFYQLGYEGEVYEVHEVGEGGRGRLVWYHGGGC